MKKTIRMCIACRDRILQKELLRLQCKDNILLKYSKQGRSFYLCQNCLKNSNQNKLLKLLVNRCRIKSKESLLKQLQEIVKYE